jgi:LuxR family quorum-sensing system transcriptional regulator ExpR
MEEIKALLLDGIEKNHKKIVNELQLHLSKERANYIEILIHYIKLLDLNKFSYAYTNYSLNELIEVKIIGNYPQDWVCAYERRKMYKEDPVMVSASKRRYPFFWRDSSFPNLNNGIFNRSSEYGIDLGYTIPLHDPGFSFGSFHLASCKDDENFMQAVRSKQRAIYAIAYFVHERFSSMESSKTENFLTAREVEVLHWSSRGKTYCETSIILGISERTVKFHAKNIMEKLHTSNMRQAISIAIRNGYL